MTNSNFSDAFNDLGAALDATADAVAVLPLSAVVEDPTNPRSTFDEAELAALAETIREKGLLQPITVRPPGPDGRHVIRFGARRFRAAQLAGLAEIRALVQAGDDSEDSILIEQLIENDQREPLNTADLARAVDRLLALQLTQSEIARRLGRPRDQVALLASVHKMPPELKALAPYVGVRTLFELGAAWRTDEGGVRHWLAGRDPTTITQAQARSLAGRAAPSQGEDQNRPDRSIQKGAGATPRETRPAERAAGARVRPPPAHAPEIEVETSDGLGVLLLAGIRRATDQLRVRMSDGAIVTVSAREVRLVRVRPG